MRARCRVLRNWKLGVPPPEAVKGVEYVILFRRWKRSRINLMGLILKIIAKAKVFLFSILNPEPRVTCLFLHLKIKLEELEHWDWALSFKY